MMSAYTGKERFLPAVEMTGRGKTVGCAVRTENNKAVNGAHGAPYVYWIPAFAGMTKGMGYRVLICAPSCCIDSTKEG